MRKILAILAVSLLLPTNVTFAQGGADAGVVSVVSADEGDDQNQDAIVEKVSLHPNDMPSVLFTYWEHTAIKDARRSRGLVRAPTEAELMKDLKKDPDAERIRPPPETRDIRLGGILYTSHDEWTIWLNEQRVTPTAIPKEVIDIFVYDEYIEIKWFDDWTNQIFPIRLRTHQRFNMDTRIFLPG